MDGMAALAAVPLQETYKDFANAILSYCKLKDVACPKNLQFYLIRITIPQSSNQLISKEVR